MKNCGLCKFGVEREYRLECHVSPPISIPMNGVFSSGAYIGWPAVMPTDWCGEFTARDADDVDEVEHQ